MSGELLPVRLYIESEAGEFIHAKNTSVDGQAIPYSKVRGNGIVEVYTTLSAHAFVASLPAGKYTLTAERGKEYLSASKEIVVSDDQKLEEVILSLDRWINMATRGWFSGEMHVCSNHRRTSHPDIGGGSQCGIPADCLGDRHTGHTSVKQ